MSRVQAVINIRLEAGAVAPLYASDQAAGADLVPVLSGPITIPAGERMFFNTGVCLELPVGLEAQVRGRSSMGKRGIITLPHPQGTIDADYRGPIGVILLNTSHDDFVVEPGHRIAQMVIAPYVHAAFSVKEHLSETKRGGGGFGSTGA